MSVDSRRGLMLIFAVAVLAIGLAACGGGNSSSSSTATGSTESAESESTETVAGESGEAGEEEGSALMELEKKVAEDEEPPVPIVLPQLSETPPKGFTVGYVTCPVPECVVAEEAAKEAAKLLGWKITVYQGGLEPETQVDANKEAVQGNPDGIISVMPLPPELIAGPLGEAKAAGIPVVAVASPKKPEGAIIASSAANGLDIKIQSEAMADWTIVESKADANVVMYKSIGIETQELPAEINQKVFEEDCPKCQVAIEEFNFAESGKKFPSEVVSYLQAHPETEYIILPSGSATAGVPQAIKGAGLPLPKIVSRTGSPENLSNIVHGLEAMNVAEDIPGGVWLGFDALARNAVGDSLSPCCVEPEGQLQVMTKKTVEDPNKPFSIPDLEGSFEKIWKLNE